MFYSKVVYLVEWEGIRYRFQSRVLGDAVGFSVLVLELGWRYVCWVEGR